MKFQSGWESGKDIYLKTRNLPMRSMSVLKET